MILSVSRRTDIPAFYSDWFFDCLKKGFVLVPNPINKSKIARVALQPFKLENISTNLLGEKTVNISGNLEGIVFWTKNPQPMIDKLHLLGDIKYYFLYTLNAYPRTIEKNLPPLDRRIESFKKLAKYCPVIWRYDPILIADGIDENWHMEQFKYLCSQLEGYTKHCKISFLIESYKGCSKSVHTPSLGQKEYILSKISEIAKEHGIQIEACAEKDNWGKYGIVPSKCIDGEIFEELLSDRFKKQNISVKRKDNKIDGQRKNCGCMPAIDIGRYDTCKHGCNYCYAMKTTPQSMLDPLAGDIYERKTELSFDYK